ncbi:TPA: hypothetical protein ACQ2HY_003320 [Klebsiella pneumoniae]
MAKKPAANNDDSLDWLNNMEKFTELSQNTAFAMGSGYWSYKYEDVPESSYNSLSRVSCSFKITKEDDPTLVGVRIPEELIQKLKAISNDAFASVLLALADAKATELLEEGKRLVVSKK